MAKPTMNLIRGATRVAFDAVAGVTGIVESMHAEIAGGNLAAGGSTPLKTRGIAGLVYRTIRGVTRGVGAGVELTLHPLGRRFAGREPGFAEDVGVAVLNGVLGDRLEETGNPAAIPMALRHQGRALALEAASLAAQLPSPTARIVVLVHGLCMSDLLWTRDGASHADRLVDLGYTTLHLRFNSGRHVSTNGREFSALLERLVEAWPVPVEELSLLSHSMGGLVSRSACHYGVGTRWLPRLRKIVFLGTPHHGAPLERAGNRFETGLGALPYVRSLARLGMARSAGVTDLRWGNLLDEDWQGVGRFERRGDMRRHVPLPEGVTAYAAAALKGERLPDGKRTALGDGLVPIESAFGEHADPSRTLAIPTGRRWLGQRMGHFDLLHTPAVHNVVATWFGEE